MGTWDFNTRYPALRRVMGNDRMALDDEAVENLVEQLFPDADPEDVENFMRSVQRFTRQAAPVAQRALPGAIQGAAQGSALGPYGALAGLLLGGTTAALASQPQAPQRPQASPAPSRLVAAPGGGSGGAVGALPGATPAPQAPARSSGVSPPSSAAAAQLLQLLTRPETMQALLALTMQSGGRPTVPVGSRQVPAAAFANAIAEVAAVAASDETLAVSPEHLYEDATLPRGDIANPSERAAILIADLREVAFQEQVLLDESPDDSDMEVVETEEHVESAVDVYERASGGQLDA